MNHCRSFSSRFSFASVCFFLPARLFVLLLLAFAAAAAAAAAAAVYYLFSLGRAVCGNFACFLLPSTEIT